MIYYMKELFSNLNKKKYQVDDTKVEIRSDKTD